ncbi:hypothetical protein KFK14_03460 [Sphingobium phenoxybenzoativorans]|uniref:DUF4239 domain-containing protein n=1 Tax=Sphingobium phenoxybenzoativorans TaxID=1592790 RepID=A0A975KAQ4_9SPHN|nr:hypothetical protein [Sphingobium phenoxybenzoativorans]QUT06532.1 hypothetical protein KFK14_03460 [Sphingobium phenoxybenzoativorans]
MSWFESAPLPLVAFVIFVAFIAAFELGYRGHGWLKADRGTGRNEGPDYLLSAVLGLLALLLGFTFSMALSRYDARRDLVVQEANAIGTVWLRAQLLKEPARGALRRELPAYVDTRLAWSESAASDQTAFSATTASQQQLWSATGVAMRGDSSALLSRGLMDSVNQAFDIASARAAARSAHVPQRVMSVLMLYAMLSVVMLGYIQAAGGRAHRVATTLLLVLLTLALVVILDLDRPRDGAIEVSQQPLEDLRASMR